MEDIAADRAKHRDRSSARVDDGPTCLTSFGMIAEPLLMASEKCVGDALVNIGAEAPKPHLPPMAVHAIIRRRWITGHQPSLNSVEGHLFPTASFLGPR